MTSSMSSARVYISSLDSLTVGWLSHTAQLTNAEGGEIKPVSCDISQPIQGSEQGGVRAARSWKISFPRSHCG